MSFRHKLMVERNMKMQSDIARQESNLELYKKKLQDTLNEKMKNKKKGNGKISHSKTPKRRVNPKIELDITQLQKKVDHVTNQIKADEAKYTLKKHKVEVKLKSKQKELQLLHLKLREKEQEKRLGILKLNELKRIIKQHKLKPVTNESFREGKPKAKGRNQSLIINQSNPAIAKTHDIQYGNSPEATEKPSGSKYGLKLAKLEWQSKANINRLHESAVDLRESSKMEERKRLKELEKAKKKEQVKQHQDIPDNLIHDKVRQEKAREKKLRHSSDSEDELAQQDEKINQELKNIDKELLELQEEERKLQQQQSQNNGLKVKIKDKNAKEKQISNIDKQPKIIQKPSKEFKTQESERRIDVNETKVQEKDKKLQSKRSKKKVKLDKKPSEYALSLILF